MFDNITLPNPFRNNKKTPPIAPLEAKEVYQGYYATARNTEAEHLRTPAIGNCVGVTIYSPRQKAGQIAHFDAPHRVEDSIENMQNSLKQRGINTRKLQAEIHGGWTSDESHPYNSEKTIREITDALKSRNIPIVKQDIMGGSPVRSIDLDLNTGEVSYYRPTVPENKGEIYNKIFGSLASKTLIEDK